MDVKKDKPGETVASSDEPTRSEPVKGELTLPEKATLAWLFQHVSVSVWLWFGSTLLAAFLLGIAVGQTTFIQELIGRTRKTPSEPENKVEKREVSSVTPTSPLSPADAAIKVWVNKPTRLYHCPSTQYYGNTDEGEYMSQQQAIDAQYSPAYKQLCRK